MSSPCVHCDEPLGTSKIECSGCKAEYHVECMAEIKSCTEAGCPGNLTQVLRQRSLAIQGGAEGFSVGQRSVALVLLFGLLFASFGTVETVTPLHTVVVFLVAALTLAALNPEILGWFAGKKDA